MSKQWKTIKNVILQNKLENLSSSTLEELLKQITCAKVYIGLGMALKQAVENKPNMHCEFWEGFERHSIALEKEIKC